MWLDFDTRVMLVLAAYRGSDVVYYRYEREEKKKKRGERIIIIIYNNENSNKYNDDYMINNIIKEKNSIKNKLPLLLWHAVLFCW